MPDNALRLRDTDAFPLASGVSTISRDAINSLAVTAGTGFVRYTMFRPSRTFTTTQVKMRTGTTAAAATPTMCKMGLFRLRPEGGGVYSAALIASTANDTTLWAAANTSYTRSWAVSAEVAAGRLYAFATICVSGAATPSFVGRAYNLAAEDLALDPPIVGISAAGATDLPASVNPVPAGVTSGVWALILP